MVNPWRLGTITDAVTGAIVGTVSPASVVGGGSGSVSSAGTISGATPSPFTASSSMPPVIAGGGAMTTDDGVGSAGSGRLRNPVQSSAPSAAMTRITTTIVGARLPRAGGGASGASTSGARVTAA